MKSKKLWLSILCLCLSLSLAVSCFNEKSSKDIEEKVDKFEEWPTIFIDDFFFKRPLCFPRRMNSLKSMVLLPLIFPGFHILIILRKAICYIIA